jgi:hypothetical protein
MTTAQDGGKVGSLPHRPPLPPGDAPGTHFCWRLSLPQGPFYLYSLFRKYVSYGFPIINFCNPGVHYETPCINRDSNMATNFSKISSTYVTKIPSILVALFREGRSGVTKQAVPFAVVWRLRLKLS